MLELMEKSKKESIAIGEGILLNATNKIMQFNRIAKNAVLGVSLILADIAEKPKEYLEGSGFSSIAEYTEAVFGYKKAYTYKLIKIAKFVSLIDINGEPIGVSHLINDTIEGDYTFNVLKDSDGFEYSPSQLLELIPLTKEQIETNLENLDSAMTCKELRSVVKNIVKPAVETTASVTDNTDYDFSDFIEEAEEVKELSDKDRVLQMLEICAGMENEEVKQKIISVFQKSLKALD